MRHPSIHSNNRGFTLVELAIALMIIGLLIGGVLKGIELVENARITSAVKQVNDYDIAVTVFRSIYNGELPGDIKNPAARLPNCTTAPCNNNTSVGTGRIDTGAKRASLWWHLQRAGLISNINEAGDGSSASPLNPFGGYSSVLYRQIGNTDGSPDPSLNYFLVFDPKAHAFRIGPVRAKAIDTKMDDGMPLTGQTKSLHSGSAPFNLCHDAATSEYLTNNALMCGLAIHLPGLN